MASVAVFDSGLGSISVIRAIRRATKADIIYFADREHFPYGAKTGRELDRIVRNTARMLRKEFAPDVIVMASNTPSLMLGCGAGIVGVYPPVREAADVSATGNVAILGTRSAVKSRGLDRYIRGQELPGYTTIHKIDASELVELVESGRFLTDESLCRKEIRRLLGKKFAACSIDAATLSSTHLSFLAQLLASEFPEIKFLDPADAVAKVVAGRIGRSERSSLRVYTSGDTDMLERDLAKLGIRRRVRHLSV